MKTQITALALATVLALGLTPKPAQAGDKELAVVGGIIGGLLIASAINDHCDNDRTYTTVTYGNGARCDDRRDYGYWDNVSVRVWVPGCWIVERRGFGHSHRRYVDGHYEVRTNRVWVAHDRRHDRRHDRYDNRHDRRDDRRDNRNDNRDNRHDRHDRR